MKSKNDLKLYQQDTLVPVWNMDLRKGGKVRRHSHCPEIRPGSGAFREMGEGDGRHKGKLSALKLAARAKELSY